MSSNELTDIEFESILNTNPIFRYNLNLIKFLNLANNKLSQLKSSSYSDVLDEFSLLNDERSSFLRPNQTGYLLGRFFNLQSLFLDDNPLLTVSLADLTSVLTKLRVLGANRCGAASQRIILDVSSSRSMIYMGLSGNKITDVSLAQFLPQELNADIIDLSFNKLSNLSGVLARVSRVNRLNLEKNLIETVRVQELAVKSIAEVNLRSNFIRNTSVENFRLLERSVGRPVALRLAGNPLICDCLSVWLLDLVQESIALMANQQQLKSSRLTQLLNRKRAKTVSSDVKLVYRRDMEVISYHNIDQDPNFSPFMQRQKRLNETGFISDGLAKFLDLDQLTCSFIDVQDMASQKRPNMQLASVDRPSQANDYDMSSTFDYFLPDTAGFYTLFLNIYIFMLILMC